MKKLVMMIMLMIAVSPCNFSANSSSEQISDGVLTIGVNCAYAPYEFTTTKENASSTGVQIADSSAYCDGYDIMIASAIAEQLDVDLEVISMSFDGLIPALNSGQIDIIVSGMSATPDRMEEIDFTDNYYDSDLVMSIVTSSTGKYAASSDSTEYADAQISSQLGTFHGDLLPLIPDVDIVTPMESVDVLIQATESGTIDGYITEHEAAQAQAKSSDKLVYSDLSDLDIPAQFSGVAIGVKKGSPEFVDQVNATLATISDQERTAMMDQAVINSETSEKENKSFLSDVWNLFTENISLYADGLQTTLILAICGTTFGTLLGFVIVGMRIQKIHYKDKLYIKFLKKCATCFAIIYIDIIRGTPMMVQAMLFFYGIAANVMEPNTAGIIIISFNTAAYMAEILRSGINAIDPGQMEAARSLGLTNTQAFMYVVLPQTVKNTLPALANQLIVNIKDSSVLSVISVSELFYATKQAASAGYQYTEAYFISAIIYLILTITLTRILSFVMKKILDSDNPNEVLCMQNIEEVIKYD